MGLFDRLKGKGVEDSSNSDLPQEFNEDYIELGAQPTGPKSKVLVRSFILEDFADIKPALDAIREGYTIALVNMGPLKTKDPVELRRAVSKLKKTAEAVQGDIAAFSEDWLVLTPGFASVHRERGQSILREE